MWTGVVLANVTGLIAAAPLAVSPQPGLEMGLANLSNQDNAKTEKTKDLARPWSGTASPEQTGRRWFAEGTEPDPDDERRRMESDRAALPAPLDIDELAELLRHAGAEHATAATIRADIEAGAPTTPDGLVDPLEYAAWLVGNPAALPD